LECPSVVACRRQGTKSGGKTDEGSKGRWGIPQTPGLPNRPGPPVHPGPFAANGPLPCRYKNTQQHCGDGQQLQRRGWYPINGVKKREYGTNKSGDSFHAHLGVRVARPIGSGISWRVHPQAWRTAPTGRAGGLWFGMRVGSFWEKIPSGFGQKKPQKWGGQ